MSHSFKKYSSITNHYHKGFLIKIQESSGFNEAKEWIVTEKVHGYNFSFIVSKDRSVVVAGRNMIIKDFKQFGHEEAVKQVRQKYNDRAIKLYDAIQEENQNVTQITIYGELFGGLYPTNKEGHPTTKPIFKEVLYHSDFDFYVFDVHTFFKDGSGAWLTHDVLDTILPKAGFFVYAKPLFRGSFEDALKFNVVLSSTIPSVFYNHPPLNTKNKETDPVANIMEGVVIKPNINLFLSNGDRVVIKKKNEKFLEITKPNKDSKQDEDVVLNKKTNGLWSELKMYVTMNRMKSTVSKMGCHADEHSLVEEFENDVLQEFGVDHQLKWSKINPHTRTLACKRVRKFGYEFVREMK
ncbi:RNA ligase [Acrasis kona]|uniref:RNA ligase n=1 Tax=Acrasis kona TaxID=1008807 RepID=A0AAW2YMC7_9EUKA